MTALGDTIEIDDRTVLVLGQELDVDHDQPDVANALVHRVGETLVVVDTGVTAPFRAALLAATRRVGDWSRALVLTTHGHTDHVGNNDIADELGVPTEHYVPARDLDQMLDPATYWVRSFTPIAGVVALPAPPSLAGNKVVSLFQPLHPFASVTRTYEERPLERIRIGSARLTGWTFADGGVQVLRSQGHCAGHVIVRLRDNGVLHLADEANGPCGAMPDSDQLKIQTTLGAAATMLEEGEATILTDGHTFTVRRDDEARSYLDSVLDQAAAMHEAALGLTKEAGSVVPSAFTDRYAQALTDLGVVGANPSPFFTAMVATNELREIGLRPESGAVDGPWSRPALTDPAPVAGMPRGLALLPAAVAMLRWKIQGRDKAPTTASDR
ncbi:MBL fold metallo-hydrolase [Pseudonocardia endophytica]|uniref:Metallo-beta-lactamase superfamily protein n=1 Tax=Pseudonocardia endophytica TaxID=401976 RepID=A0A4R1HXP3_PSEEN|nr:MBL fold metallo-hydrolase [Pseudonocardia endophytica]TCK27564.1 metallo-beta-lactamase superfamily protein [Pseudonocardia endophytica]